MRGRMVRAGVLGIAAAVGVWCVPDWLDNTQPNAGVVLVRAQQANPLHINSGEAQGVEPTLHVTYDLP